MAARLGQGKTWSLARMACAAAFSGYNIQYDALEGTRPEIAMRIHTFASSEYGKEVFKNLDLSMGKNFSPRAYKEFLQSLRNDVKGRMHIADTTKGPISPLSIAAQIERNRVDIVYLDYITLMDGSDGASEGDWKSIGKLSKSLKQIAQMYQTPIVAAAQLNREAANMRDLAGPDKLAESDSIGRDADAVITARQMSKHVIAMKLAKYRHGRDGFVWYTKFLPNTGHFEEITFDEAQDAIAEDKDSEVEDDYKFKPRQKGSFKQMSDAKHKTATINGKKVMVVKKNAGGASKSTSNKKVVVKRSK
jgi:replicative DNA helicase